MWTFFIRECIGAAVLAVATGAIFALGELLRRTGVLSPEQSRKLLHIGGCVTALLFPVLFHSHWSVLVICGGFFLLILCDCAACYFGYLSHIFTCRLSRLLL